MFEQMTSAFLSAAFTKFFSILFPSNALSTTKEVVWKVDVSSKGISLEYESKKIELSNKQVRELLNDQFLFKEYQSFSNKISQGPRNTQSKNLNVKTKDSNHSLELEANPPIKGYIKFNSINSLDDFYKKAFLRREKIKVEDISFETINPENESKIEPLKQMLKNKESGLVISATHPVNTTKCKIIFESDDINKHKFFNVPIELSLFDYTESTVIFNNHLELDPLFTLPLKIPLNNSINEVCFNYSLTKKGEKDVQSLIMLNTLNRLMMNLNMKLKVINSFNDYCI
ncbi:hypothetical protein CSV77_16565 [Sporosarcina sp. P16b]|uniref:hypothetical protein n=1 Tax=Sporosarcina sp. P16b TaxID=2048261 RepID=UPI000C16DDD8|nr:hypothetical protein [Sporosarcina sp. P16b]PIC68909.1 hypothetical protein CSV77_16565 [Sporosarcina sp. P16b]